MLPEPILKWKSCLLMERPWTSLLLILFLILLSFLLYYITVTSYIAIFLHFGNAFGFR